MRRIGYMLDVKERERDPCKTHPRQRNNHSGRLLPLQRCWRRSYKHLDFNVSSDDVISAWTWEVERPSLRVSLTFFFNEAVLVAARKGD